MVGSRIVEEANYSKYEAKISREDFDKYLSLDPNKSIWTINQFLKLDPENREKVYSRLGRQITSDLESWYELIRTDKYIKNGTLPSKDINVVLKGVEGANGFDKLHNLINSIGSEAGKIGGLDSLDPSSYDVKYHDANWILAKVNTHEAAVFFGRKDCSGSTCTSRPEDDSYFKQHTHYGAELYYLRHLPFDEIGLTLNPGFDSGYQDEQDEWDNDQYDDDEEELEESVRRLKESEDGTGEYADLHNAHGESIAERSSYNDLQDKKDVGIVYSIMERSKYVTKDVFFSMPTDLLYTIDSISGDNILDYLWRSELLDLYDYKNFEDEDVKDTVNNFVNSVTELMERSSPTAKSKGLSFNELFDIIDYSDDKLEMEENEWPESFLYKAYNYFITDVFNAKNFLLSNYKSVNGLGLKMLNDIEALNNSKGSGGLFTLYSYAGVFIKFYSFDRFFELTNLWLNKPDIGKELQVKLNIIRIMLSNLSTSNSKYDDIHNSIFNTVLYTVIPEIVNTYKTENTNIGLTLINFSKELESSLGSSTLDKFPLIREWIDIIFNNSLETYVNVIDKHRNQPNGFTMLTSGNALDKEKAIGIYDALTSPEKVNFVILNWVQRLIRQGNNGADEKEAEVLHYIISERGLKIIPDNNLVYRLTRSGSFGAKCAEGLARSGLWDYSFDDEVNLLYACIAISNLDRREDYTRGYMRTFLFYQIIPKISLSDIYTILLQTESVLSSKVGYSTTEITETFTTFINSVVALVQDTQGLVQYINGKIQNRQADIRSFLVTGEALGVDFEVLSRSEALLQ